MTSSFKATLPFRLYRSVYITDSDDFLYAELSSRPLPYFLTECTTFQATQLPSPVVSVSHTVATSPSSSKNKQQQQNIIIINSKTTTTTKEKKKKKEEEEDSAFRNASFPPRVQQAPAIVYVPHSRADEIISISIMYQYTGEKIGQSGDAVTVKLSMELKNLLWHIIQHLVFRCCRGLAHTFHTILTC